MGKASVSLELIKDSMIIPSSPTPPSLKHYMLSFIDQLSTSAYVPIVLFFAKEPFDKHTENASNLECSLSELLTSYYPFAGRKVGNISVECNDKGVLFREVRVNCSVSEILEKPHATLEDTIFPVGLPWGENVPINGEGSLVVAQLSHFECGGKTLSLCISHKLADGATLFNFFSDWASMASKTRQQPCPLFNSASIYPPIKECQNTHKDYDVKCLERYASTRIIFGSSKIELLKAKVTSKTGMQNPTRVEVVTSLLTKTFLAASMVDSPCFKPILLYIVVNLRSRTSGPILQNSVGNFYTFIAIPIVSEEDMELESLVAKIRSEKVKSYEKYKGLKSEELIRIANEDMKLAEELACQKVDVYSVTSMCGFPYQDLDFGWGKPLKVSFAALLKKNYFVLVNDHTGKGVEAIATLEEKLLNVLEKDQEFLSFATLEPLANQ